MKLRIISFKLKKLPFFSAFLTERIKTSDMMPFFLPIIYINFMVKKTSEIFYLFFVMLCFFFKSSNLYFMTFHKMFLRKSKKNINDQMCFFLKKYLNESK